MGQYLAKNKDETYYEKIVQVSDFTVSITTLQTLAENSKCKILIVNIILSYCKRTIQSLSKILSARHIKQSNILI